MAKEIPLAKIDINPTYLSMVITFYPAFHVRWKNKLYERCGTNVLHEFCHGFLKPLQHQWQWNDPESQQGSRQEIVERQTTRIQNAISGVLPEDWFMPVVVISKTKSKTGNSRYHGIVTWSAK